MNREDLPVALRTKCEVWTRVMGYHRPVDSWNDGKQSEHRERKHFKEAKAVVNPLLTERNAECVQGREND